MCLGMHSVLTPALVLMVLLLVNGVYTQNLFPPVQSTENFALRQPATATSTCRTCAVGQAGCAACNNSCPYNEQQLPEPLDLLEVGTLASGVVQTDMNSGAESPIYKFNGSQESFVGLPEELTFQPSRGFTFTAWVQQDPGNEGYVFAKTTRNGATTFYALSLDSIEQSATFVYRHEGLEEGFRSSPLLGINVADRRFHHIAVSVFGSNFALYVDGQLHPDSRMLVARVEDGSGVVFLGRRVQDRSRFSGLMHSVFYFNSTLSDNNIATLAGIVSDLHIQPECQCPPSHSIVLERECQDLSGTHRISRINSAAHDATYINDGDTSTWWQSSNGEAPVNVTVSLGGLRAALIVVMHFKSLLPRAMVLHYSTDGELFSPRQVFAVNCSMFSFLSSGLPSTSTDVSCVALNSSSLRDQSVEFRVLDVGNQPSTGDYFINSDLLEFAQASHVQLELLAWDTDQLADQYFAISEVIVTGQACVCNGHATMCRGAACVCEQNTTGTHCKLCLEGYFNYTPEVCELCQCDTSRTTDGSNVCDSATGQCPCESNFVGLNCSLCASGYYWNERDANCLPCNNQCLDCTGPGPTNCEVEETPTSIRPTPLVESSATLLQPMSSAMIEPQVSAVFEDMVSSINQLTLQPPLPLAESITTQILLSNQVTNLLQISVFISTATARPMKESLLPLSPSSKLLPLSESPSLISSSLFEYEGSSTHFPSSLLSNIQPTTLLGLSKTPVPTFSFLLPPQLFHTSPLEPASTSPPAPSSSLFEGLASSNNTLMSSSDQVTLSNLLTQNPPRTPVMPTTSVTSVQTEIPSLLNQTNTPFLTQLTATSSNSAVSFGRTSIQMPTTQLPMLTTHPFLSVFISKSVVQLISAEVSTSSLSSIDPASVSAQLTITRIHTSFSQSSSRSDTYLPTSVGTIEPTNVLNSSVQVTPSLIRRTSVSAVISTDIPHMSSSQLMAVPSTTPLVASPTLVSKTEGPKPISQSPSFTLMTTPGCPQSLQVVYTAIHLVDIVLALIVIEHMELVVDRSPRQCRLEQALVEVFDLGLQRLSERSQRKKKRQLQNSGTYAANITEVGQLSNSQSTITFYITDVTSAVPLNGTTVVQAFLEANQQEIGIYPVIRQASPHVLESSTRSPTVIPIVAGVVVGGSVFLVGVLLTAVLALGCWCYYRKKQKYELDGEETQTFLQTSDFDERSNLVPSPSISTRELPHTDMEDGAVEDEQQAAESQAPATFFERVTHYNTPRSSPLMQPKFRETVAPPSFTPFENSQNEYIDGESDGDGVQGEVLHKNIQRLQEERDQQELKARRKATLKRQLYSGSRRKRTKVDLSTHDKHRLLHSQNHKKALQMSLFQQIGVRFEETVDASLPIAIPTSYLPGSPTYPFTRYRLPNHVVPLVRLPRSQHATLSHLSTSGRLSQRIAHDVHQELTWMRTGSGVQLRKVQPAQMVGQSSPVPTQFSHPQLFTRQQPHLSARKLPVSVLDHTPETEFHPQDDESRSSGEASQATSPDRQQEPEVDFTQSTVQDLLQQAFMISYTTPSTHQGQVVWISTDHSQSAQSTQLHSSPTLGLQENQNSTNTSLHDHEQSFPSPQHAAHS